MFDIALPLIGGLVLLVMGGELLVRGAVQVARRFGSARHRPAIQCFPTTNSRQRESRFESDHER